MRGRVAHEQDREQQRDHGEHRAGDLDHVTRGELGGEQAAEPGGECDAAVAGRFVEPEREPAALPRRLGFPPACRTRSSSEARTVPVESEAPATRRMSSHCSMISSGLDAVAGEAVQRARVGVWVKAPEPLVW